MERESEERPEIAGPGGEPPRIKGNKNRRWQAVDPQTKRKLFDKARKRVFLEWFAGTANLSWAARMAGVHYRTVLTHRMEKPNFREQFDAALEQGLVRVQAWLVEAEEAEDAAVAFDASGPSDEALGGAAEAAMPAGGHRPVNLTPELAVQLIRDNVQRLIRGARGGAGAAGPGQARAGGWGRPPTVASNAEVRRALVKQLRAFGVRLQSEDGR